MMYPMSRSLRALSALGLILVGGTGAVLSLTGQGLDRAEKWVSIVGTVTSVALAVAGLGLGWLTWRQAQRQTRARPTAVASPGIGAVAVGGDSAAEVSTEVAGIVPPAALSATPAPQSVSASGLGSVAIGGNSTAPIRSKVTGPDEETVRDSS